MKKKDSETMIAVPNYCIPCDTCGQEPTVEIRTKDDKFISNHELCGPCTFGTAEAIDPETWSDL